MLKCYMSYNWLIRYGCDLACTPMIISDSFVQSVKARDSDFTTNLCESKLASFC